MLMLGCKRLLPVIVPSWITPFQFAVIELSKRTFHSSNGNSALRNKSESIVMLRP